MNEITSQHAAIDPAPTGLESEAMDFSKTVILIVDDNDQNVELLQAYLEPLQCRTLKAADGFEAMRIIEQAIETRQNVPDLVLLDVMMPKMSGFEVCRKLKEDAATRSIPVMMVTALNELGDIERGVESGTDDFLSKPVNKLELLTRAKSLLRIRYYKNKLDQTRAYLQDIETRHSLSVRDDQADAEGPGSGPVM